MAPLLLAVIGRSLVGDEPCSPCRDARGGQEGEYNCPSLEMPTESADLDVQARIRRLYEPCLPRRMSFDSFPLSILIKAGRATTPHLRTPASQSQSREFRHQRRPPQRFPYTSRCTLLPSAHKPLRISPCSGASRDAGLIRPERQSPGVRDDHPRSRVVALHLSAVGSDDR